MAGPPDRGDASGVEVPEHDLAGAAPGCTITKDPGKSRLAWTLKALPSQTGVLGWGREEAPAKSVAVWLKAAQQAQCFLSLSRTSSIFSGSSAL